MILSMDLHVKSLPNNTGKMTTQQAKQTPEPTGQTDAGTPQHTSETLQQTDANPIWQFWG